MSVRTAAAPADGIRHTVRCPVCGSAHSALALYKPRDYFLTRMRLAERWVAYRVCRGCGLVFQNPMITEAFAERLYSGGNYHDFGESLPEAWLENHEAKSEREMAWVVSRLNPMPRALTALEVGCGAGFAVAALVRRGWAAFGIEPEKRLVEVGRERFGLENLVHGFFGADSFPGRRFSLITSSHVFEHLLDPLQVLCDARGKIEPDGYLHITVPTFRESRTKLAWHWFNACHTYMFTHQSLANLLARAGFRMTDYRYNDGEVLVLARPGESTAVLPSPEPWRRVRREIVTHGLWYFFARYAPRRLATGAKRLAVLALGRRRGDELADTLRVAKQRLGLRY